MLKHIKSSFTLSGKSLWEYKAVLAKDEKTSGIF